MTAHKHAAMIKAKADNMGLVVFTKIKSTNKWAETQLYDIADDPKGLHKFFLCLPQHKEACLHWLNGGAVIADDKWKVTPYSEIGRWSNGSFFMDGSVSIRIKPRKEKRWIAVTGEESAPYNFANLDCAKFWVDKNASKNSDYWQFIEIEVEI